MNSSSTWNFISTHGLVMFQIFLNPTQTVREMAKILEITERSVIKKLKDLEKGGYIEKQRDGRRNFYLINSNSSLKHPTTIQVPLKNLLDSLVITNVEDS